MAKTLFVQGSATAMGDEVRGAVLGAIHPIYAGTAFVLLVVTAFVFIRLGAG